MTEDHVPAPEDSYGIAKYAVEMELRACRDLFGLNYVVLALAVRLPFRPDRYYALPVLWRVFRKKGQEGHYKRTVLAAQLIRQFAIVVPTIAIYALGIAISNALDFAWWSLAVATVAKFLPSKILRVAASNVIAIETVHANPGVLKE